MKKFTSILLLLSVVSASSQISGTENEVLRYIDGLAPKLVEINEKIWQYAEPSFKEFKSSALLKKTLQENGFTILENAGGINTQFMATYGNKKPVIGLFGEYDADSGASNKTVPYHEPFIQGGFGHGGGHNLLGVGSLGAVLAIKKLVQDGRLNCTIKYFGTTAEGGIGGKTYLAQQGLLDDLDLSLYWHPSPITKAVTRGWDALIEFRILFTGKQSDIFNSSAEHDAQQAMIRFLSSIEAYKYGKLENTRLNYVIQRLGTAVTLLSDTAEISVRIVSLHQEGAMSLLDSITSLADILKRHQPGIKIRMEVIRATHQFVINTVLMKLVHENMRKLGPIVYSQDEHRFAKKLQEAIGAPPTGLEEKLFDFENSEKMEGFNGWSSDIGDASWFAPEAYFTVACLPNVPMHRWTGTAFTTHTIGQKGMIYAAKVLALSIVNYVGNKRAQDLIRQEFKTRTGSYTYRSLIGWRYVN